MWKNRTKAQTAARETGPRAAWSMPPELERALPRNVELNPSGVSLAVIAVLLGVVAIGSLGAFSMARGTAQRERESLERSGVGVEAVVVGAGRNSGDDKRRYAIYRYVAGGREHPRRVTLRHSDHRSAVPGDRFDVRYLPDDPGKSWVVGYEPEGPPAVAMVAVPLTCAAMGLLILWTLRRQLYLLAEGRATQARVVEVKRVRRENHKSYRVAYEFTAMSGGVRRIRLDARRKPEENAIITLVYDRENPRRAAVYPFPLVRVVRR
jgi:hypothetical protein